MALDRHGHDCVVGMHGMSLASKKMLQFSDELECDTELRFIGSGTACFIPSQCGFLHMDESNIVNTMGADLVLSRFCIVNGRKMFSIKRPKGYLKSSDAAIITNAYSMNLKEHHLRSKIMLYDILKLGDEIRRLAKERINGIQRRRRCDVKQHFLQPEKGL